ncbi:MAG: peptide ABC transporter substrate-binding protein [Anaerolineales bacterium]|nr:peptide ABC transporter substrate-binding protein [Anaerolineales bacterium]
MRPNLRWQLLLAAIGFGLVFAILSFQVQVQTQSGDLFCTATVPVPGGNFVEGIVGAPRMLNPLLSDIIPVEQELVDLIFDGLTDYDDSGRLVPALAERWSVAEDGRSIQFVLREGVTWHDGEPVTAADVAFTYGLMQDDAFPGTVALHDLWQSVTIRVVDERTVEFILSAPYSPFMEATTRGILPAHLLQGETAVSLQDHPFNLFPIGTGPFMVDSTQNWQESGRLVLTPNPDDWPLGTQLDHLEFRFFSSETAVIDAFTNGEIQAINRLTAVDLPKVADLPDARLFTTLEDRQTMLLFNQRAAEENKLQTVSMRQALAYGLDRQALIDTVLSGQGVLREGPYLPGTWAYTPHTFTIYENEPVSATVKLEENGWLVPEGQIMRWREGEPLSIRLVALESKQALVTAVVDQWATLGIDVQLNSLRTLADLQEVLAEGSFDVALVDVTPSRDPDLYDFWSQEAIVRGQNYGGWNNRRASIALESGRQLWRVEERRPFYDTFLRLYDAELPALTLYQHVTTYVVNSDVNHVDIGLIQRPRDRYATFNEWFLHFQEKIVFCPGTDVSE